MSIVLWLGARHDPPMSVSSHPPNGMKPPVQIHYVGLTTRAIAAVIDAALIIIVAIVVELGAALIVSLLHLPHRVKHILFVIGGIAYILWTIGYFVGFWSTTGQTPGNRAMQFRVLTNGGKIMGFGRALLRFVGVVLAALPLFLGYLIIPFNSKRRGFQDLLAGTVVVEASQLVIVTELARGRLRAGGEASLAGSSDSGDDQLDPIAQAEYERERVTPDSADRS
jgi:uncharacterized RDD family membrane protein YckC